MNHGRVRPSKVSALGLTSLIFVVAVGVIALLKWAPSTANSSTINGAPSAGVTVAPPALPEPKGAPVPNSELRGNGWALVLRRSSDQPGLLCHDLKRDFVVVRSDQGTTAAPAQAFCVLGAGPRSTVTTSYLDLGSDARKLVFGRVLPQVARVDVLVGTTTVSAPVKVVDDSMGGVFAAEVQGDVTAVWAISTDGRRDDLLSSRVHTCAGKDSDSLTTVAGC